MFVAGELRGFDKCKLYPTSNSTLLATCTINKQTNYAATFNFRLLDKDHIEVAEMYYETKDGKYIEYRSKKPKDAIIFTRYEGDTFEMNPDAELWIDDVKVNHFNPVTITQKHD